MGAGGTGQAGALGTTEIAFSGGAAVLHLRAALEPLLGCLYALAPVDQEVLALRAGLDGRAPVSRGQVAAAFGVTPGAIARTERSGLRALRSASAEDGCMAVAGTTLASAASRFLGGPFGPVGFVTPIGSSRSAPAVGGTPTRAPDRIVESPSLSDSITGISGDGGAGPFWLVVLITLLFFASAGALAREVRRSV